MWEQIAAIGSIGFASLSLVGSWLAWRRAELKSDDVLNWSMRVIAALKTIALLTDPKFGAGAADADETARRLAALAIETSVLTESGRLFFRNTRLTLHGRDKPSAYRGYRTVILDQILIAHQVACAWEQADANTRARLHLLAEDCTREFVSLAQKEVGRSRTVSSVTKKGGTGAGIETLAAAVDAERVARLVG
jgi:hypothetical protein